MKFTFTNSLPIPITIGYYDNGEYESNLYVPGNSALIPDTASFLFLIVDDNTQFKLNHSNRIHFEFLQVKPNDSNHPGKDSYVFLINYDWNGSISHGPLPDINISVSEGGGDGEVDPPDDDIPPFRPEIE